MTLYFWDASDFDWPRGPMSLKGAKPAGISGFTFKATEGTTTKHVHLKEALERARDAGIPFIGAYMVPRTPGNGGNGTVAAQVAYFTDYLRAQVPWLFDFPGRFAQVDTEVWSGSDGQVYDHVSANTGHNACELIRAQGDLVPIHYAPRWAYGDAVPTADALWSSTYPTAKSTMPATRYREIGGAGGSGWEPYGAPHARPALWQFAGGAVTIGSQPKCDVSAYEGTVAQFASLIGRTTVTGPTPAPAHSPLTIADANTMWHNGTQPGAGVQDVTAEDPSKTFVSPAHGLETAGAQAFKAATNTAELPARLTAIEDKLDKVITAIATQGAAGALLAGMAVHIVGDVTATTPTPPAPPQPAATA